MSTKADLTALAAEMRRHASLRATHWADRLDQIAAQMPDTELLDTLKTFARDVLDGYRTGVLVGDIDGGWLQDHALALGLLVESGSDADPNYYLSPALRADPAPEREP